MTDDVFGFSFNGEDHDESAVDVAMVTEVKDEYKEYGYRNIMSVIAPVTAALVFNKSVTAGDYRRTLDNIKISAQSVCERLAKSGYRVDEEVIGVVNTLVSGLEWRSVIDSGVSGREWTGICYESLTDPIAQEPGMLEDSSVPLLITTCKRINLQGIDTDGLLLASIDMLLELAPMFEKANVVSDLGHVSPKVYLAHILAALIKNTEDQLRLRIHSAPIHEKQRILEKLDGQFPIDAIYKTFKTSVERTLQTVRDVNHD